MPSEMTNAIRKYECGCEGTDARCPTHHAGDPMTDAASPEPLPGIDRGEIDYSIDVCCDAETYDHRDRAKHGNKLANAMRIVLKDRDCLAADLAEAVRHRDNLKDFLNCLLARGDVDAAPELKAFIKTYITRIEGAC